MLKKLVEGRGSADFGSDKFQVSNLLEEVVETFSILEDKEAMSCIKQAEEDAKAGRVRGYGEFLKELKKSGET